MTKYPNEDVTWTIESFVNSARPVWGYDGEDRINLLQELVDRVSAGFVQGIDKKKYLKHIKKALKIARRFNAQYTKIVFDVLAFYPQKKGGN